MADHFEIPEELLSLIEKREEEDRRRATSVTADQAPIEPYRGKERRVANRRADNEPNDTQPSHK